MRKRKRNNDENSDKTGYRVQDDYANDEANTPVRSDRITSAKVVRFG